MRREAIEPLRGLTSRGVPLTFEATTATQAGVLLFSLMSRFEAWKRILHGTGHVVF